jgi:hypothetical protein
MKRLTLVEFLRAPREALKGVPFELFDSTGVLAVVLAPRTNGNDRRQDRGYNWPHGRGRGTRNPGLRQPLGGSRLPMPVTGKEDDRAKLQRLQYLA